RRMLGVARVVAPATALASRWRRLKRTLRCIAISSLKFDKMLENGGAGGKSSEPKSSEPKSSEPKSSEPKSSEPKSSEPKFSEPKSPEPRKQRFDAQSHASNNRITASAMQNSRRS